MKNKHGIKRLSSTNTKPVEDELTAEFTATIHRNFRDTNTISAKVLLQEVHCNGRLIRDHMWVSKQDLLAYIPKTTKYSNNISFTGVLKPYQTRAHQKQTIVNIYNIQLA